VSGFLPVAPSIHPAKPENAVSQQLLGRFRSSFEELKIEALPLRLRSQIVISDYIKLHIFCVKVTYIFS
jgi:hypothetical protein